MDLEDLGLVSSDFATLRANLLRPFGMILITGLSNTAYILLRSRSERWLR